MDTLTEDGIISTKPISREILHFAAEFRARHKTVRAADAIHIGTARAFGSELLLSNDRALIQAATAVSMPAKLLSEIVGPP